MASSGRTIAAQWLCSLEALVGMTQPMLGCREGFDAAVEIMCLESAALEPKTLLTPLLAV